MVVMETGHADVPSGRMAPGCHSVSGLSGMRSYRRPRPQRHTAQGQATQNTHRCEDPQVQSGSSLRVSSSPSTLGVTEAGPRHLTSLFPLLTPLLLPQASPQRGSTRTVLFPTSIQDCLLDTRRLSSLPAHCPSVCVSPSLHCDHKARSRRKWDLEPALAPTGPLATHIPSVGAPRTMLSFALGNGLLCLPPPLPSSAKYLNPEPTQER